MSNMNARVFQYYLDNFLKFPKEIRNDIVYCQRSLKAHIKVHQMVIDVFEQEEDADPVQKQRILDEIESEIYEINAEQHFLLLRIRRIIDEFSKMLKRNDIPMNYGATNAAISREVVPFINDQTIEILPATVLFRNTEQKLIEKYFEVQKEKVVYEIEDSDEDDNLVLLSDETKEMTRVETNANCDNFTEILPNDDSGIIQGSCEISSSLSQMSLLKPISQRMVSNAGLISAGYDGYQDASKFLQMNLIEEKSCVENPENIADALSNNGAPIETQMELPVSKNVKISRLNLRQALNKARTENMVAKAAANILARSVPSSKMSINQASTTIETKAVSHSSRKYDIRTRAARNNVSSELSVTSVSKERNNLELNSSSEDSNPERIPNPRQHHLGFMELKEKRTIPEHYGQEMFLRFFQLFTPIVLVQMQQRRSKRKRRTVHNNERADFHYGRIEYGSYPPPEKKRKAFLLSPQVKRVLQSKRPKRGNVGREEDIVPSRSSSSSPDEKRCCNECLASGGCFEQCAECKGYYHQLCHAENLQNLNIQTKSQQKLCPACKRTCSSQFNEETQQYKHLHSTAEELEKQLAHEKVRRASLQQESKMYKLQMRNLFNIVNTIKSDQENDSSG